MRTLLGFMARPAAPPHLRLDIVADSVDIRNHVGNLPGSSRWKTA